MSGGNRSDSRILHSSISGRRITVTVIVTVFVTVTGTGTVAVSVSVSVIVIVTVTGTVRCGRVGGSEFSWREPVLVEFRKMEIRIVFFIFSGTVVVAGG